MTGLRRWVHDLRHGYLRFGVVTLVTDAKASRDVLTAFEVGRDFERRHTARAEAPATEPERHLFVV